MTAEQKKQHRLEVHRRANATYRSKNREKIRAYNKQKAAEKRKSNPERYRAIGLACYHRNKHRHIHKTRARTARWYAANKDRAIMASKLRRMSKPEARRADHARRRARKLAATIDDAGIKDWMKQIRSAPYARCHWCGTKVAGRKIHFDHVVALSRGGTHTIGNLCASCPDCNLKKHARVVADWICQGQTFLSI